MGADAGRVGAGPGRVGADPGRVGADPGRVGAGLQSPPAAGFPVLCIPVTLLLPCCPPLPNTHTHTLTGPHTEVAAVSMPLPLAHEAPGWHTPQLGLLFPWLSSAPASPPHSPRLIAGFALHRSPFPRRNMKARPPQPRAGFSAAAEARKEETKMVSAKHFSEPGRRDRLWAGHPHFL